MRSGEAHRGDDIGHVVFELAGRPATDAELLADWRGSELRADVTAEQEAVHVRVWQDGVHALEWLVEKKDFRIRQKPFAEDDLLLISAG